LKRPLFYHGTNNARRSRQYAVAQSLIVIMFGATALLVREPPLFTSRFGAGLGEALCVAGLVVMAFAFSALRGVIQVAPEPKAGGHLVTTGIYHWLRHPIYTAIVTLVIGLVLRKPTLWLAIAAVVLIAFFFVKTRFEERLLAARYPQYAEYRKRSWGLIPGLR
jgi:protein-S-isoprenylcysteine O-methyltransferase Ste14